MKKILFAAAIVLGSIGAKAQQGSWYAGGNVGLSSSSVKNSDTKSSSWNFSPEVGTFLTDNVQLGVGLTLLGSKNGDAYKTSQTGATVYSRYFFGSNAFRPFVGVNVSALPGKMTNNGIERDFTSFGANLNAGFGYALSPKITAVGSFGALGFSSTKSGDVTTNTFGLNAGTLGERFNVGIYYTFK